MGVRRRRFVLDCDGLDERLLASSYSATYQHLLDRVKPVRAHNPRSFKRERWWMFGENQPGMRRSVSGLARYIATPETATFRTFQFFPIEVLSEGKVTVIALADAFLHGVLSSRVHVEWAMAAGGNLGVGNDSVYVKTDCFDKFPFPDATDDEKARIRGLGEALDAHRKRQQGLHPKLTMTDMYNVLERLRAGEPLSEKERATHEQGLVSVLKQIHDDLDRAVFEAYGWSPTLTDEEILERLVALNAERAREEKAGVVRWLRPEFQNPQGAGQTALATDEEQATAAVPAVVEKRAWPAALPEQVKAVRAALREQAGVVTAEELARAFARAPRKRVEELLVTLAALGQAREVEAGRYAA